MINLQALAIGAGATAIIVTGAYFKGRSDNEQKWLKVEIERSAEALEEKEKSQNEQSKTARGDTVAVTNEIARLRRILEQGNANDVSNGRMCLTSSDAIGLRDDYNEIFEKRLQPIGQLNDAE